MALFLFFVYYAYFVNLGESWLPLTFSSTSSQNPKPTLKICSWNVRGIHNPIKRKKKILSFLKKEHVHIAHWICDNTVIAGDFNCYFSSAMDRSPPVQSPISRRVIAISDTCNELSLVDTWRVLHPNDKEFTFYSTVHKTTSRTDFF